MANVCPNGCQEAKSKGGLGLICKDALVNLQSDMQRCTKDIQRCTKPFAIQSCSKIGGTVPSSSSVGVSPEHEGF